MTALAETKAGLALLQLSNGLEVNNDRYLTYLIREIAAAPESVFFSQTRVRNASNLGYQLEIVLNANLAISWLVALPVSFLLDLPNIPNLLCPTSGFTRIRSDKYSLV